MYNHNFIIGQLVVAANQPKDINEDKCKADEFKFITYMTNQQDSLTLQLAYIVL